MSEGFTDGGGRTYQPPWLPPEYGAPVSPPGGGATEGETPIGVNPIPGAPGSGNLPIPYVPPPSTPVGGQLPANASELGRIAWAAVHGGNPAGWEQVDAATRDRYIRGAAQAWVDGQFGNNGDNIVNVWQRYGFDQPPPPPAPPAPPAGASNTQRAGPTGTYTVAAGLPTLAESGKEAEYRQQFGAYAEAVFDAISTYALLNGQGRGNDPNAQAAYAEYARLNGVINDIKLQTGAPPTQPPGPPVTPGNAPGTPPGPPGMPPGATTGRQGWPPGKQLWADQHGGDTSGWDAMVAAAMAGDAQQQEYLNTWNGEAQRQGYTSGAGGQNININTGIPDSAYGSTLAPGSQTPFGVIKGKGDIGLPEGLGLGWHQLLEKTRFDRMLASGYLEDGVTPTLDRLKLEADRAAQQAKTLFDEAALTGTFNGQQTLAAQQLAQQARQFAASLGLSQQELDERIRQYSSTLAEQTRQFNVGQAFREGEAVGRVGGQETLAAQQQRFLQEQAAYERAANPARAFENELARGVPAGGYAALAQPYTGQAPPPAAVPPTEPSFAPHVMPPDWQPSAQGPAALVQPTAQPAQAPMGATPNVSLAASLVRVPAVVNALKTGGRVSTAGAIGVPSTQTSGANAAITEDQFRRFNLRDVNRLDPDQQEMVGSFARAGGVSNARQKYLTQRGMPRGGNVTPTYSSA